MVKYSISICSETKKKKEKEISERFPLDTKERKSETRFLRMQQCSLRGCIGLSEVICLDWQLRPVTSPTQLGTGINSPIHTNPRPRQLSISSQRLFR